MKFLVAVTLAIFAFQCVQSSAVPEDRSFKDTLVKAVKKFKGALQTAHDEAHDGIQKGIDAVNNAFATAEKEVNDALTHALDEILALEEEAAEQGVETVECTHAQREKCNALRDETVAELDKVGKETKSVLTDVQSDVDGVLQGFVDVADGVLVEFESCKSILCQTKVLASATTELAEITLQVPGIVAKAITDATTTSAHGVKTVAQLAGKYVVTTDAILKEVAECIKEKVEA